MKHQNVGSAPRRSICAAAAVMFASMVPVIAFGEDAIPAPSFKPGMAWVYRQRAEATGRELGGVRIEVVSVAADRITASFTPDGGPPSSEQWDAAGNWQRLGTRGWPWLARLGGKSNRVEFLPALTLYRFPLQPGTSWAETLRATDPDSGRQTQIRLIGKALQWEDVTVPAGKFKALRVRRTFTPEDFEELRSRTTVTLLDWYSPQVSGSVRSIVDWEHEDYRRSPGDQLVKGTRTRWELTAYAPGK